MNPMAQLHTFLKTSPECSLNSQSTQCSPNFQSTPCSKSEMAAPSAARTSHHEPAFYGNANFIAQWSTEEILQVMQDDLEAHLVLTPLLEQEQEQEQEHLKLFMALEHNSLNQSYKVLSSSKISASALIKLGQSFKNCSVGD